MPTYAGVYLARDLTQRRSIVSDQQRSSWCASFSHLGSGDIIRGTVRDAEFDGCQAAGGPISGGFPPLSFPKCVYEWPDLHILEKRVV
jgi:hypothetical protein